MAVGQITDTSALISFVKDASHATPAEKQELIATIATLQARKEAANRSGTPVAATAHTSNVGAANISSKSVVIEV